MIRRFKCGPNWPYERWAGECEWHSDRPTEYRDYPKNNGDWVTFKPREENGITSATKLAWLLTQGWWEEVPNPFQVSEGL